MPQLYPIIRGPRAPSTSLAPSLVLAPDSWRGSLTAVPATAYSPGLFPKTSLYPAVTKYPMPAVTTGLVPATVSSGSLSPA